MKINHKQVYNEKNSFSLTFQNTVYREWTFELKETGDSLAWYTLNIVWNRAFLRMFQKEKNILSSTVSLLSHDQKKYFNDKRI